ncbi:hypothetical protein N7474_009647 [Penicillium riverlandense]|uniref:uncharacterized protein n=1 Tax=Penicillium riverlandense TaxID=1903569 RepID=UPI00254829DF|nr:uncharacterized protein N7474_009647 [Penicillium riverlandense]KAJ5808378.1 hypothetical protein N7474_009647 [Penicillium riverlandense]
MLSSRVRRPVTHILSPLASPRLPTRQPPHALWRRFTSSKEAPSKSSETQSHWFRHSLGLAAAGTAVFLGYTYVTTGGKGTGVDGAAGAKKGLTPVDYPSSQFVQEKRSLKSPGVYTWGSNVYRVVDPDSKDTDVKIPRRFSYFDGQVLRDFKIDDKAGAAITENGDLVQWGKGFSETNFTPTKTLTGKSLVSLSLSEDRIIALSSNGTVYSLPISQNDQQSGPKTRESSWIPFWDGQSRLSYRVLQPALKLGESVTAISTGQEHALLLTSSGRVFSAAASTEHYPLLGQLGVPGLTWSTRPSGPVDSCHEVATPKGVKIAQIATGDYHSVVLSKDGRLFAFGDNSFGQLGVEFEPSLPSKDTPFELSLRKLYKGGIYLPTVTSVAAGGANTFFTVDVKRVPGPGEEAANARDLGRITADTWACGRGIWGTLGNGRWIHLQDEPTKVKALSGLSEYDEKTKHITPIRLRDISVGTTHVSAVMDNKTHLKAATTDSLSGSQDWGFDVLWWGGNEHFQLGTGKRTNLSKPTYIGAPDDTGKKSETESRLQIMPRHKGQVGKKTVSMEQRVSCGRHVSAIYSAV